MSRLLTNRIAKLEAKHRKDTAKVVGIIGSRFGHMIVDPGKPGHLKWAEPPGGFDAWALQQQRALQVELAALSLTDAPQPKAPNNVGTVANNPAPLKPGQKQPNFVHLADGTEIKIKRN
jgi:hypothetical protein